MAQSPPVHKISISSEEQLDGRDVFRELSGICPDVDLVERIHVMVRWGQAQVLLKMKNQPTITVIVSALFDCYERFQLDDGEWLCLFLRSLKHITSFMWSHSTQRAIKYAFSDIVFPELRLVYVESGFTEHTHRFLNVNKSVSGVMFGVIPYCGEPLTRIPDHVKHITFGVGLNMGDVNHTAYKRDTIPVIETIQVFISDTDTKIRNLLGFVGRHRVVCFHGGVNFGSSSDHDSQMKKIRDGLRDNECETVNDALILSVDGFVLHPPVTPILADNTEDDN